MKHDSPVFRRSARLALLTVFSAAGILLGAHGLRAVAVPGESRPHLTSPGPKAFAIATVSPTATASPAPGLEARWKRIDRLVSEQKFEAAAREVAALREAARAKGDEDTWTRALVREVQLRMGLHGYETAVRFLREQPWPQAPLHRATLNLFYGHSLVQYASTYAWEIGKRERVEASGSVDLRKWTREQIHAEAQRAYGEVWKQREALGKEPIGRLAEYLAPNNYPPGIRDTLRDALTYLFVDLLANTAGWTPEQSNDLFRLPLDRLAAGEPASSARVDPAAPDLHPLVRACALLDDLEAWHIRNGRLEGALEARLERLRRLHAAFDQPADRAVVISALERALPAYRKLPWWAMGVATLAEFIRAEASPGHLVRARNIAREGERAYPGSIGGKRCAHIVRSIEAPDFQISAMAADGPDRRSVLVTHKNVPELHFAAYAVDFEARLADVREDPLHPGYRELREIIRRQPPLARWRVPLPATPDFELHRTFVTPPLHRPGLYVIVASARPDPDVPDNRVLAVNMVVSDLVMLDRDDGEGGLAVTILSGSTGKPVPGAEVGLYRYNWRTAPHRVALVRSDNLGEARFAWRQRDEYGESTFLVARKDGHFAVDPSYFSFFKPQAPGDTTSALIYTDRAIYRPEQKVRFKIVAFRGRGDQARFRTLPDLDVKVSLVDANGQAVRTLPLRTNRYGTASGTFTIPAGRALGQWRIQTSHGGAAPLKVEEYKRPTFEVKLKDAASVLRLNRPATLSGEARYYFGLPVTTGNVRYRVTREPVYPWWWDLDWRGWQPRIQGIQTIAAGVASLAPDGSFTLTFTPAADERLSDGASRQVSFRYAVSVDVTDEGGETRSAERSFRLGTVAIEASFRPGAGFFRQGATASVIVTRTDLDGVGRPGAGQYTLESLRAPADTPLPADLPRGQADEGDAAGRGDFQTPGDRERARWETAYSQEAVLRQWKDGERIASGTIAHGENGEATVALPRLEPGAYRLRYETTDPFGARFEAFKDFVVAGPEGQPLPLPAVLEAESPAVRVGGTARFLVDSGLAGQTMLFDRYRSGKLVERRRLVAGKSRRIVEFPIGEDDRGGFGVVLTVLRDHQLLTLSKSVFVPWDDRELRVSFSTFRDTLRPGSKESWKVTVKGPGDSPVLAGGAELLAYMYDRSLDLFAVHRPPSPLSLYPNRTGITWSRATLGMASGQWLWNDFAGLPEYPSLAGDRLLFFDGYGIGGPGYRGGRFRTFPMPGRALPPASAPAPEMEMADEARPQGRAILQEAKSGKKDESEADARSGGAAEPGAKAPDAPRTDFSETAFFEPHLELGTDGEATLTFQVPDSVTAWNVWVHAITTDLKGGSLRRDTRTVKELMVRPYLPRFLREGDRAELQVVVNNASAKALAGTVQLEIVDPDSGESILPEFGIGGSGASSGSGTVRTFAAPAGGSGKVSFSLVAPRRVRPAAVKVVARAGDFSDGELRALPILPGRMHLAQSRFATLRGNERRELSFPDMARGGDPSRVHDALIVTVDAQLFYSVLSALPYLVDYPYECTEQTMNRFLSTGIVSSLYDRYPAVARMAREFAKRDTPYESWADRDPNRKLALEESPWLAIARGGEGPERGLARILDPRIARATRDGALARLRQAQLPSGAFPWWAGGPPSPYITLYLMHGFARAAEFDVDVPRDMVRRAWAYLADEVRRDVRWALAHDCCWESLTFVNYVAGAYPDETWTGHALTPKERRQILDFSFRHWRQHSPYLKGLLALTLKRMGRPGDAKLVWDSVMDSARTTRDEGTFWAPEERAWLWYNDTIETHAFALRTLMELSPGDPRKDGIVQWLLLNKKLNHWKSTRATAEVIYALVHYLEREKQLGSPERIRVQVGSRSREFHFEPERYTGRKNQVVVPGQEVDAKAMSTVVVSKPTRGFAFVSATWHYSTEKLPHENRGDLLAVSRQYFRRDNTGKGWILKPLAEGATIAVGDQVEVHLSIRARHPAEYVHLRDPRPAGFEPDSQTSRWKWDLGLAWYEEIRDSGANFFFEALPQGEYTLSHRLRATMAGTFRVSPAQIQSMYAPEFTGFSTGNLVKIGN